MEKLVSTLHYHPTKTQQSHLCPRLLFLLSTLIISTSTTSASHYNTVLFIIFWTPLPKTSSPQLLSVTPSCLFFSAKIKRIHQHLGLQAFHLNFLLLMTTVPTSPSHHIRNLWSNVWPLSRVAAVFSRIDIGDPCPEESIASATLGTNTSLACDGGLEPEGQTTWVTDKRVRG